MSQNATPPNGKLRERIVLSGQNKELVFNSKGKFLRIDD